MNTKKWKVLHTSLHCVSLDLACFPCSLNLSLSTYSCSLFLSLSLILSLTCAYPEKVEPGIQNGVVSTRRALLRSYRIVGRLANWRIEAKHEISYPRWFANQMREERNWTMCWRIGAQFLGRAAVRGMGARRRGAKRWNYRTPSGMSQSRRKNFDGSKIGSPD